MKNNIGKIIKYTKPLKYNNPDNNYMPIISKILDICPNKAKYKDYLIKKCKKFLSIYKGKKADLEDIELVSSMFCFYLLKNGNENIRKILLGE